MSCDGPGLADSRAGRDDALDPDTSRLLVDVDFADTLTGAESLLANGHFNDQPFTATITQLDLNAQFEVNFVEAYGLLRIRSDELLSAPIDLLTSTQTNGHAAFSAELVTTLNAANPPPPLVLEWTNLSDTEASISNIEVWGNYFSSNAGPAVAPVLLTEGAALATESAAASLSGESQRRPDAELCQQQHRGHRPLRGGRHRYQHDQGSGPNRLNRDFFVV